MDLLVLLYIFLFLFYPYSAGGFRFIMPVIPFVQLYMARGLRNISLADLVPRPFLVTAIALLFTFFYKPSIVHILETEKITGENLKRWVNIGL